MARLPRLMGRGRALEVLLSADDIHGELAERYDYVNRSILDSALDGFVDTLARRIASFDKEAIAETKRLVKSARFGNQTGMGRVYCLSRTPRKSKANQGIDGTRLLSGR